MHREFKDPGSKEDQSYRCRLMSGW